MSLTRAVLAAAAWRSWLPAVPRRTATLGVAAVAAATATDAMVIVLSSEVLECPATWFGRNRKGTCTSGTSRLCIARRPRRRTSWAQNRRPARPPPAAPSSRRAGRQHPAATTARRRFCCWVTNRAATSPRNKPRIAVAINRARDES